MWLWRVVEKAKPRNVAEAPAHKTGRKLASTIVTTIVINGPMQEIQLRDAKATLSAVIDSARQGEPSIITRHGKREAVLLSFEDWERLSRVPSFGRLLMAAPLGSGDLPDRDPGALRETGL